MTQRTVKFYVCDRCNSEWTDGTLGASICAKWKLGAYIISLAKDASHGDLCEQCAQDFRDWFGQHKKTLADQIKSESESESEN